MRDTKVQAEAILQVAQSAAQLGWHYQDLTWSETVGPAGNIEYLLWLRSDRQEQPWPQLEDLHQVTKAARLAL